MKKIKHVNDLPRIDSLVESAYNSHRALEWAEQNKYEKGKDPNVSLETVSSYFLLSDSDDSDKSQESLDLEAQILADREIRLSGGHNPMDEAKMSMLGFEKNYKEMSPSDLIASIKDRISYFNQAETKIPDKTTKAIYKKLCSEF